MVWVQAIAFCRQAIGYSCASPKAALLGGAAARTDVANQDGLTACCFLRRPTCCPGGLCRCRCSFCLPACLQKDTFKQDAVFFCGVLLLFYTLVQAWTGLFSGSSGLSGF